MIKTSAPLKEFNVKIALPLLFMFVGLLLIFVVGAYLFGRPLEWPEDYALLLFLPLNFYLFYSGRKKIIVPLLEFLDSDFADFNYRGHGKLEERIWLGETSINFSILREALGNIAMSMTFVDENLGLIKMKDELSVLKNQNALVVELNSDEAIVRCYSFNGRSQTNTRQMCQEVVDLLEVLRVENHNTEEVQ